MKRFYMPIVVLLPVLALAATVAHHQTVDSAPHGGQPEPPSAETFAEGLDAVEIQTMASEYGIAQSEAAQVIRTTDLGEQIQSQLSGIFGTSFTGYRLDADTGRLIAYVARDSLKEDIAKAHSDIDKLLYRLPYITFVTHAVDYDDDDLQSVSRAISQLLDRRLEGIEAGEAASSARIIKGYGVRPDLNVVEALVLPGTDTDSLLLELGLPERLEGAVRFVETDGELGGFSIPPYNITCEVKWSSCNPVRGATELEKPNSGKTECTIGFNANAASNRYVLTSAHCLNGLEHSNASIGGVANQLGPGTPNNGSGNPYDVQAHASGVAGWTHSRWIIHTTGTLDSQAYQISNKYGGTNVGQVPLCVTGALTRKTICPTVSNPNMAQVEYNTQYHGIRVITGVVWWDLPNNSATCPENGDSGAPIYSGGTAYAMLVGGFKENCQLFGMYVKWVADLGVEITITP